MKFTLAELKKAFPQWEFRKAPADLSTTSINALNHDSRTIDPRKNELFIIARGPTFDPHDYIDDALKNGAVAAMCERGSLEKVTSQKSLIVVEDAHEALMELGKFLRSKISGKVFGITGSTGKSLTRAMLAEIIENRGAVLTPERGQNINTLWGNIELLMQYDNQDYIVLENSTDARGELLWQLKAVQPGIGCILNIGEVHAGPVGGVQELLLEKKDAALYLEKEKKPVILNIDDPKINSFIDELSNRIITVSIKRNNAHWYATDISVDQKGTHFTMHHRSDSVRIDMPIYGDLHAYNALFAAAFADEVEVDLATIQSALNSFSGFPYRFEVHRITDDIIVVDDAYNANNQSMPLSISTFMTLWGCGEYHTVAILGDMRELGEVAVTEHEKLGELVRKEEFDEIFYVGEHYKDVGAGVELKDRSEVLKKLQGLVETHRGSHKPLAVLIKASHGIELYGLVQELSL